MSNYKARSDYFKMIAHKNKLIAHAQPVAEGSEKLRKSFHRVNDLDELNAACESWAHFPCAVHVGHDKIFKQVGEGITRRVNANHLFFFAKIDSKTYPALSDAMENAYDVADTAMSKFLSYMREDLEANGACGNLFLFDLNRATAEQIGPYNSVLYGWQLTFYDEQKAWELCYKEDDWFEGVDNGITGDCGCPDPTTGDSTNSDDAELIYFNDEEIVSIDWTIERKQKLGTLPLIQVYIKNEDDSLTQAYNPIKLNDDPSEMNVIKIYNGSAASGIVILKKSVA